jgi:4-amino-4-deoxy-L-arabinose transferase-like glycosyltransferase
MKNTKFLLLLIVVLAILLRFWQLGNVPISPDWDEASFGYNAYSILETGKDEYGKAFPIILRSFDDYKPALYAYLVIPFVKVAGLNTTAVRLPSAIFGVLTIVAVYFLTNELFKNTKFALLVSFLLAISPWHIQFSRIAFEANVGLALNVFAALFFLKGLRQPWFLLFSAAFGGLSLYVYQGEKIFTPLLILLLCITFRKNLLSLPKKNLIAAIILGLVISLPMVGTLITNSESLKRAQGVSIFIDQAGFLKDNVVRIEEDWRNHDPLGIILDNRRFSYVKSFISGYLSHFDLNWLFIKGDLDRHHAPGMGLMYLWEFPFLFVGIYQLLFGKFDKKTKLIVFGWFLITPIPASVTTGVPHAIRTLNFLPTLQVFTALGIIFVLQTLGKQKIWRLIACFYALGILVNLIYYIDQYFVQQNYFNAKEWQYGYKEVVSEISTIENKYEKIIVSNQPYMDQSYMFFLYYLIYPPAIYQKEAIGASGGFRETHSFGKFEFRPIVFNDEKKEHRLFVGRPDDFPQGHRGYVKSIYFPDGKEAIRIVE